MQSILLDPPESVQRLCWKPQPAVRSRPPTIRTSQTWRQESEKKKVRVKVTNVGWKCVRNSKKVALVLERHPPLRRAAVDLNHLAHHIYRSAVWDDKIERPVNVHVRVRPIKIAVFTEVIPRTWRHTRPKLSRKYHAFAVIW